MPIKCMSTDSLIMYVRPDCMFFSTCSKLVSSKMGYFNWATTLFLYKIPHFEMVDGSIIGKKILAEN